MRDLPTKANRVARVRTLDGELAPSAQPLGARAPASAAPDTGGRRPPLPKLLRFPEVRELTGLSRSTVWRLERRGDFPKHHRIAPNVVAWLEDDVARWISLRTDAVAS